MFAIFSLKCIRTASQNFYPSYSKWRTEKWIFSCSGPQNELSRAYISQCFNYLAKMVLDEIYTWFFSKKLQSLKEKPLKSLLIRKGNYFPFLGFFWSWNP